MKRFRPLMAALLLCLLIARKENNERLKASMDISTVNKEFKKKAGVLSGNLAADS